MNRIRIVKFCALALALNPAIALAADRPTIVSGGGGAVLTDPDLNLKELGINVPPPGGDYPLAFAMAARVRDDGVATGSADFVFGPQFSQVFDADFIVLTCKITGGRTNADGSVTLTGISHERDFVKGQGIIFEEISPIEIVVTGDGSFTMRWCSFSGDFEVEVTHGKLSVR